MIQKLYRRHIIERFMTANELTEFDTKYQSQKAPTSNNLGQKTFDQLVEDKVRRILNEPQP